MVWHQAATHPDARCLCDAPACDHVPLRYALRAWLQHRLVFGFRRGRRG